ncbi:MAG: hypothetical protein R6V76_15165 [Desulfobacterales bacterium]
MKKNNFIISLALVMTLALYPAAAQSQPGRGGYGYGMGQGMMGGWDRVDIPSKLPAPKNAEWIQKLKEILMLEKQSLVQYQADQEKFNAYMPYMMIIPQEENHIEWIGQLFEAYDLTSEGKDSPVVQTGTLTEAYELSQKMEADLLPRYEWLVKNAEDRDSAQALNTILIQSRWHMVMFEHAIRMGHGYGFSRGPERRGRNMAGGYGYGMGQGMMGGYGYGMGQGMMGPGYSPQYRNSGKPIDLKEAKAMMSDYMKSSRNPNLKLGKIKDSGEAFEAEILTKKNDLVDRVYIDKATGSVRSAY